MSISEVSVQDLKGLLETSIEKICILDVRQPWEFEICRIPNSINIPLDKLTESLDKIPTDKNVYTLCHHGMRSLQALYILQASDFKKVANIKGGIDSWSREVDPTTPTY